MQHYSELSEHERQLIEINRSINNNVLLTRHCRPVALSAAEAKSIEIGHVNSGVIYANTSEQNLIIKDAVGMPIIIAAKNVDRRLSGIPRLPWMKPDNLYVIRFNSFDASALIQHHRGRIDEIATDTVNAYTGLCSRSPSAESPHQQFIEHGLRQNIYKEVKPIADGLPTPITGFTVQEIKITDLSKDKATYIEAADVVVAMIEYREVHDGLYRELKYRGDLYHPSVCGLTSSQMHMLKNSKDGGTYFREIKVLDNKRSYENMYVYVSDFNGITPLIVQYDSSVTAPTIVVTEKDKETGALSTRLVSLEEGHTVGVFKTEAAAQNSCPTYIKNATEKIKEAEKTISEAEHRMKVQDIRERINTAERKEFINKTSERANHHEGLKIAAQLATSFAAILAALATIIKLVNQ
jgi:hypothetical protein